MKAKILLITDVADWALGHIAWEIASSLESEYEFRFATSLYLGDDPDLVSQLVEWADIVHALDIRAPAYLQRAPSRKSKPLVTWVHHLNSEGDFSEASASSQAFITSSQKWKAYLVDNCKVVADSVSVIPYGVNTDFFRPMAPERLTYNLPDDGFVIGFVAKRKDDHGMRKGFDILMQVSSEVVQEVPNSTIFLNGPGLKTLHRDLLAQGVNAVLSHGLPHEQMPHVYSVMDALLITSRLEGGPCTLLEAMACCRPVISTDVGIVQDVITHGRDGLVHDVEDASGLMKSLVRVAKDPGFRRQLGQRARSTVEAEHQWRMRMPRLKALYEDALKGYPTTLSADGTHASRGVAKLHLTLPAARQRSVAVLYDRILWNLVLALTRQIPLRLASANLLRALRQLSFREFSCLIVYLAERLYKKARRSLATVR